jgi:DNA-binding MarR family transcriptional regulator
MPNQQPRRYKSALAIAELFEYLSQSTAARAYARGLNPTQWAALRYFSKANEDARNIGAFARYNFTSASSASQTLTALVSRGLVEKSPGPDGRIRLITLTVKGRRRLAKDPITELAARLQKLSDEQLGLLAEILAMIIPRD